MFKEFVQKMFAFFQGRHTFFALFFTLMGTIMAWYHRLDMSYVALVTAVQGLVFAHSYKEDQFGGQDASSDPGK
jgi:hydrogenase/urease accessory protein HupE